MGTLPDEQIRRQVCRGEQIRRVETEILQQHPPGGFDPEFLGRGHYFAMLPMTRSKNRSENHLRMNSSIPAYLPAA